jgi:hypothetical protein
MAATGSIAGLGRDFSGIQPCAPTPRTFLDKTYCLMELKQRFASQVSSSSEIGALSATDAALRIHSGDPALTSAKAAELLENIINGPRKRARFPSPTHLLNREREFPHSVVAYHGNESSLLHDIYGCLVHTLAIGEKGQFLSLPRIHTHPFDSDTHILPHLKNNSVFRVGCDHGYRETIVAASPTLISDWSTNGIIENAWVAYENGANVAEMRAYDQIRKFLLSCRLVTEEISPEFSSVFWKIERDFPQQGYLWQFFFHDLTIVDQLTYPCIKFGAPLLTEEFTERCTTSEFLSALKSGDAESIKVFENKYDVKMNKVQLRILADPRVFIDQNKIGLNCFRKVNIAENKYFERINKDLIDPIFLTVLANPGPGGLMRLSPLVAEVLGGSIHTLPRLADYIFSGADHPKVCLIGRNETLIEEAIRTGRLLPTSTFGTDETALEIALLAGQKEVFLRLFEMHKNAKEPLSEWATDQLLSLTFKHELHDSFLWLLEHVDNVINLDQLMVQICKKNAFDLLLSTLTVVSQKDRVNFIFSEFDHCIEICIEYNYRESFELLVKQLIQNGTFDPVKIGEQLVEGATYSDLPVSSFCSMMDLVLSHSSDKEDTEKKILDVPRRFPRSYLKYYQLLSAEERLKLPLQRWWAKGSKKISM